MIAIEDLNVEERNVVIARQKGSISVPVTVRPRVITKDAILYCCGDPVIEQRPCEYSRKSDSSFVLSQNICVKIPIEFSADVIAKDAYVTVT